MPLIPQQIRYIELGPNDAWARVSLRENQLHFGYGSVPHELCLSGNWDAAGQLLISQGRTPDKAQDIARELQDFYTLGPDCLWVTFAHGYLWWAYAEPEVIWLGESPGGGARMRKTVDGWHNSDADGWPLRISSLSSRLTAMSASREALHPVDCGDHLLQRLAGTNVPIVARARSTYETMLDVAEDMVANLNWPDFEDLVLTILARLGWQRASWVGGSQTSQDLEFTVPGIGIRSYVCLRSQATRQELDDFVARHSPPLTDVTRFFICRNPLDVMDVSDAENPVDTDPLENVEIWSQRALANCAVVTGLFEWLINRCV